MNILYISNLSGNLFAGPNNSVPAQIKAQSEIDNVFWYNINHVKRKEWEAIGCSNLDDYPTKRLDDLPAPFSNPDIAVLEEFYCFPFCRIISDLQKKRIPYIIIPRSELTYKAQKKKSWKKRLANLIYFNNVVKRSAAIQYLTEAEKKESEQQWKHRSIIIPNGTSVKGQPDYGHKMGRIRASYIGRFEIYQKGLDLLIAAISDAQKLLRESGFFLKMYGVNQEKTVEEINELIRRASINDLVSINEAVYGSDKEKILKKTDVFIMTSRFEGMPMGLIEALSYGIPCLATEGTNMSNDIDNYNAGWYAGTDVSDIVNALVKMVEEQDKYAEKSRNAHTLALKYSWSSIAKITHNAYKSIAQNR